jgi:hypothetical protein
VATLILIKLAPAFLEIAAPNLTQFPVYDKDVRATFPAATVELELVSSY